MPRLHHSQWWTYASWSHSGVCSHTADPFDCAPKGFCLRLACLFVFGFTCSCVNIPKVSRDHCIDTDCHHADNYHVTGAVAIPPLHVIHAHNAALYHASSNPDLSCQRCPAQMQPVTSWEISVCHVIVPGVWCLQHCAYLALLALRQVCFAHMLHRHVGLQAPVLLTDVWCQLFSLSHCQISNSHVKLSDQCL